MIISQVVCVAWPHQTTEVRVLLPGWQRNTAYMCFPVQENDFTHKILSSSGWPSEPQTEKVSSQWKLQLLATEVWFEWTLLCCWCQKWAFPSCHFQAAQHAYGHTRWEATFSQSQQFCFLHWDFPSLLSTREMTVPWACVFVLEFFVHYTLGSETEGMKHWLCWWVRHWSSLARLCDRPHYHPDCRSVSTIHDWRVRDGAPLRIDHTVWPLVVTWRVFRFQVKA